MDTPAPHKSAVALDEALRGDIRLLGRILGDTIRAVEGPQIYGLIETLRQLAVRFHRDQDHTAQAELEAILASLSDGEVNKITRAFGYFSILANIAEDHHHTRRWRAHQIAGSPPREGSLANGIATARAQGFDDAKLKDFFETAYMAPVLTAHPTEVQRRSILDTLDAIAALLVRRDRLAETKEEYQEVETELRALVLTLWQTRTLRQAKLSVLNEVENALIFFESTFFTEVPRLYAAVEKAIGVERLHSFLEVGTWIGGDRDGNPFVDGQVLTEALGLQAERAFGFYIAQARQLGKELSLASLLAKVTVELLHLAACSPDKSEHRADEPYRLALGSIQARLAATICGAYGTIYAMRVVLAFRGRSVGHFPASPTESASQI